MRWRSCFELHATGEWDVLVLDTPPSRNALDFLDAPKRLTNFIEGRGMQMFHEAHGVRDADGRPRSSMALGVLKRILGIDLLSDLAEFFEPSAAWSGASAKRAKRVTELLGARRPRL